MTRPPGTSAPVIFTIVSMNYLSYAATLMQTVRAHHPEAVRVIILADTPRPFAARDLAAELIPCDALGIGLIDNLRLWYSVIEFNTALKPHAIRYFLDRGHRRVCYLDPDIMLFAPLREALALLDRHSLVLTPHLLRPLTAGPVADGLQPDDHTILKAGAYNLGFLAVRRDADTAALMDWWVARCHTGCRVDVDANLFVDQRWMDLAPGFVPRTAILRHPGYNVAYWNVSQRPVRREDGAWHAGDAPLVFFHFSGLRPDDPTVFSAFQTRVTAAALGAAAELCAAFRAAVIANGWREGARAPYAYGRFADGRTIEAPMRRWLLRAADEDRIDPMVPIEVASDFFDIADETAAARGIPMTRMMYQLWLDRPDLRLVFDVHVEDGLEAYLAWFTGPDSEVEPASVAAAEALAAAQAGNEVDPTRQAVAQAMPAPPAPWVPVAGEAWAGAAAEVERWLACDAAPAAGETRPVPLLAALTWERRPDLQAGFPLGGAHRLDSYMTWLLTAGCAERVVDPALFTAAFLASQQHVAVDPPLYEDVPITEGLRLTAGVRDRRAFLNGWEQFPHERRGRLAHGVWFAYVAPLLYGWPAALVAPVRAWFDTPTDTSCAGFGLSRGALALWELRRDLQALFPLHTMPGRWGFLHWLVGDGLNELGLMLDQFDTRLRAFLAAPSFRLPGLAHVLEMAHAARPDLQGAFDVAAPEGRQALLHWAQERFAVDYADRPVLAVWSLAVRSRPPAAPVAAARHHAAVGLIGQLGAASGRAEDLRSAIAAFAAADFDDYVVYDFDSGQVRQADGTALPAACAVQVETSVAYRNADTAAEDWRVLRDRGFSAGRRIACWAWELPALPPTWRHALSFYDELWAATEFSRAAFVPAAEGTGRPVRLVPMAVVVPSVQPRRELFEAAAGTTLFLFAFDFRSHASRKNPEAAVQAFLTAFPAAPDVRLLIKTQAAAAAPAAWRALHEVCSDPRIVVHDAVVTRAEMMGLVAGCDALLSLHRAEGFGRLPAEAMALGRPVVATAWSGPADFLDAESGYPVASRLVPVAAELYPGGAGQSWAEPDVIEAAACLRRIREAPAEAAAVGARGRARIAALYGAEVVGRRMLAALGLRVRTKRRR